MSGETAARAPGRIIRLFGRDLPVAFTGHAFEKLFNGTATLLLVGALDPDQLGVYRSTTDVLAIGAKVSDLGLDTGTVRAVATGGRSGDGPGRAEILKSVFFAKLVLATVAFVLGWVTAPLVAGPGLHHEWLVPYLRLGYFGLFGKQLTGFYKAYFSGQLLFVANAVFTALGPAAFLGGILIGLWRGELTAAIGVGAFVVGPLIACTLATALIGRRFLLARGHLAPLHGVWTFSRWIYAADVMATLRFRLASPLLLRLEAHSAGIFSAAESFASIIAVPANTLFTVLLPRASHLEPGEPLRAFLRKSYRWSLLLAIAVPLTPLAAFVVRPLVTNLKPEYLPSLPVFVVLFVSMLFTVVALPSRAVLYAINRPAVETWIEAASIVITLGLFYVLIPRHGAMGAAFAMLAQRVFSATALVGYVHRRVFVHDEGAT